jgi:hypothetical protein
MEPLHRGIHIDVLPREQGDYSAHAVKIRPLLQGKWNVEVYIDEFKDLIDLSGYTDPITIMLKFYRGLNSMTQDRITESGMDRPSDIDLNGWFKAA